jgi:hypothetical protein
LQQLRSRIALSVTPAEAGSSLTIAHNFGDVVLVPFPFTDQSAIKKRPAIVVGSAAYLASYRSVEHAFARTTTVQAQCS